MGSVAEERVEMLLQRAVDQGKDEVDAALRIAEKHNISLSSKYRLRICDGCKKLLHPGENATVRVSSKNVKYSCELCGEVNRHGYQS